MVLDYAKKKQLYETIMHEVAKTVKHILYEQDKPLGSYDTMAEVDNVLDNYMLSLVKKAKKYYERLKLQESTQFFSNYDKVSGSYAFTRYGLGSLLLLEERIPKTARDAHEVAEEMKSIFKLDDFQIEVTDIFDLGLPNIELMSSPQEPEMIGIIIDYMDDNYEVIEKYMNRNGYTLIREAEIRFLDNKRGYAMLYTPIYRTDIRNELTTKWLYHVSYPQNRKSILENGLVPQERNGGEENAGIIYPPRVYFTVSESVAEELREDICSATSLGDVFRVWTEDLKNKMEIYYDPLYGKNSVYVNKPIPPDMLELYIYD